MRLNIRITKHIIHVWYFVLIYRKTIFQTTKRIKIQFVYNLKTPKLENCSPHDCWPIKNILLISHNALLTYFDRQQSVASNSWRRLVDCHWAVPPWGWWPVLAAGGGGGGRPPPGDGAARTWGRVCGSRGRGTAYDPTPGPAPPAQLPATVPATEKPSYNYVQYTRLNAVWCFIWNFNKENNYRSNFDRCGLILKSVSYVRGGFPSNIFWWF